jgi:hypothetical protein
MCPDMFTNIGWEREMSREMGAEETAVEPGEDRMDDSGRGNTAGDEASSGNDNAEHHGDARIPLFCIFEDEEGTMSERQQDGSGTVEAPPVQRAAADTFIPMLKSMVDGVGRDYVHYLMPHGDTYVLIVRMKDVQHQTKPIPLAGSPGSGVLFIDERAVPETSPVNWIRERIQEHLAVTPHRLVVLIPVGLINFLIIDALSRKGRQLIRQLYWKSIQEWREDMDEKSRRELQECTSGTEVAVSEDFDWDYKDEYISGVQTVVAAVANTDMSPFEICSLVRKGQRLPEAHPDHYPDTGLGDGMHACRFAMGQPSTPFKELVEELLDQFPRTFMQLGWVPMPVPITDKDEGCQSDEMDQAASE